MLNGRKSNLRVSSVDVAKRAGVSQATVSRVFSPGASSVSADAREKVLKAAKELHYQPNFLAKGLNQRITRIIGIINPEFEGSFYIEALKYFTLELQKRNYASMLLNIPKGSKLDDVIPIAFQYQVDGILTTSVDLSSDLVNRCLNFGVPVLQFNRYSIGLQVSSVCLDNVRAGREAAEFLMQRGHQRISYISGDVNSSTNKDRCQGFSESLERYNCRPFSVFEGNYRYESGYRAATMMLSKETKPDGVFCASDEMAIGFIDCAEIDFNLKVPNDISVMGFNNSWMSATPRYNLTTINQPVKHMAEIAVAVLIEQIEKKSSEVVIRMIAGEIIERGTVKTRS